MPAGRTARVHAGRRRDLGPGEPRRGRDQRARGARGGSRDGAGPRRRAARAGLAGLAGRAAGTLAALCVAWIIEVAEPGRRPARGGRRLGDRRRCRWRCSPCSWSARAGVARGCCGGRSPASCCCLVLVVGVLVRPGDLGWPPRGWVLVACDVGQGDALVLQARRRSAAVVVDAGPDAAAGGRVPGPARRASGCRCSSSPTSTPTTSTGWRACWTAGRSARWWSPGWSTRRRVSAEVGALARAAGYRRGGAVRLEPDGDGDGHVLQTLWPLPGRPSGGPGDGSRCQRRQRGAARRDGRACGSC